MKQQLRQTSLNATGRKALILVITSLSIGLSNVAQAYDKYQYEVLLNPTPDMLESEARGRIMIYDGLENEVVETALNEQFERIENMMFVRTRYLSDDGEILVEEDGCD